MHFRPQFTTLRAYAVIVQGDEVLLCRLGNHSADSGLWTLPGGGGEFGESPEETCHRELMEETGLTAILEPFPFVHSRLFENDDSRVQSVRFFYRASVTGGTLRNESDGSTDLAAWVKIAEIPNLRRADIVNIAFKEILNL
jgi:ADP-ribose pyrophosphatase YjhB (NUDIX family)